MESERIMRKWGARRHWTAATKEQLVYAFLDELGPELLSLFDRYLGELSYPIYIGHLLVIWLIGMSLSFEPPKLTIPAGGKAQLKVNLRVDPAKVRPWALEGREAVAEAALLDYLQVDGWVVVNEVDGQGVVPLLPVVEVADALDGDQVALLDVGLEPAGGLVGLDGGLVVERQPVPRQPVEVRHRVEPTGGVDEHLELRAAARLHLEGLAVGRPGSHLPDDGELHGQAIYLVHGMPRGQGSGHVSHVDSV